MNHSNVHVRTLLFQESARGKKSVEVMNGIVSGECLDVKFIRKKIWVDFNEEEFFWKSQEHVDCAK